jgi:hypothetical protein
VDRLRQHVEHGRRFEMHRAVEEGDQVAVALGVTEPGWPGTVEVAKVFRFRDLDDKVVFMADCRDWEDALARLGGA